MQALTSLLLAAAWMEPMPPPLTVLRNPDFDTDPAAAVSPAPTNWRWFLDDGAGGELVWDGTTGAPAAGSGRVRNNRGNLRADFWGQCLKVAPGPFTLRAAVASQLKPNASCELRVEINDRADCSTTPPGATNLLTRSVAATTNNAGFETVQISAVAPLGSASAWVLLAHRQTSAATPGYSYCHFDHVEWAGSVIFSGGFE